jgi:hypothetical protein
MWESTEKLLPWWMGAHVPPLGVPCKRKNAMMLLRETQVAAA